MDHCILVLDYFSKWFAAGHIILRGWCENLSTFNDAAKFALDQKKVRCALKTKLRQQGNHMKKAPKKENKVILWFEVDDTGCGMNIKSQELYIFCYEFYLWKFHSDCLPYSVGIDPSKWESVFESFEQVDPSTTRL